MQTTLSDYAVGFAANLTLGSMTANIPGAPANFSGTNSYTHDAKLQLTQETSTRAGGYTNNQVYDGAGNPTTFKGVNAAFNSANQNTSYTHDGAGNPTTYKGSTLAFNAENRMTWFGSVLTAGYRADGKRLEGIRKQQDHHSDNKKHPSVRRRFVAKDNTTFYRSS